MASTGRSASLAPVALDSFSSTPEHPKVLSCDLLDNSADDPTTSTPRNKNQLSRAACEPAKRDREVNMWGSNDNLSDQQVMSPNKGLTLPASPQSAALLASPLSELESTAAGEPARPSVGATTMGIDPLLQFQHLQNQSSQREQTRERCSGTEDPNNILMTSMMNQPNFIASAVPKGDSPSLSMAAHTPRVITQTITRVELDPQAPQKRGRSSAAREPAERVMQSDSIAKRPPEFGNRRSDIATKIQESPAKLNCEAKFLTWSTH